VKFAGRSDHVDLDRLERFLQDPTEPVGRVPEVVEVALPIERAQDRASLRPVSFLETQDRGAEQHAVGCQDVGDVPDRHGLVRLRSTKAVEHVGQRHRVERALDRQGLHHVRLDGGRVHRREPA
jgi:hypothetical protein